MKFISLFTKAPQHQRFNYTPRFYDPRKEEMEERERRIREELALEKNENVNPAGYRSRIAGSFQAARKRSKPSGEKNAVMLRLAVLLFLTLFIMAFLTWGKVALYSFFAFVPFYLYLKFKKQG